MAYDFPASPTNGDEYTPPVGGQTYIYQSPRWLVKGVPPAGGGGGGGVAEAPVDTKQYGRQDAAWTEIVANPTWATLSGKPATFPPDAHVHAYSSLTGIPSTFAPSAHSHPQSEVTNLITDLSGKAPTIHTHVQSDVTGLTAALAAKEPTITGGTTAQFWRGDKSWQALPAQDWSTLTGKPATFPPTLPIAQSGVTSLVADLALKAPLASPVFTGDAQAVTPATSDNDTSIATTAYVKANMALVPAATAQTMNRIVNGAMQVSQENGNTVMGVTATYAVDQWQTNWVSAGVYTSARVQVVTPNGSVNRLRLAVTTADAALAVGDFLTLSQKIEGIRVADFKYGAAGAVQSVLRFGFKAPAGTYSIFLQNSAANRSYVQNFTIAAGQANTDTVQTLIIPGDITGTWLKDTGVGLTFGVAVAAGTTFQTTAGAWAAGSFYGTATNTNGLTPVASTYELFDVGLYLDPNATGVAPLWQMPDEVEELRACQRYYGKYYNGNQGHEYGPASMVGTVCEISFPTEMRVTSAVSLSGSATLVNCTLYDAPVTTQGVVQRVSVTGTAAFRAYGYYLVCNSRM